MHLNLTFTGVSNVDLPALWAALSIKGAAAKVAKIYLALLHTTDLNPFSLLLWSGPTPHASKVYPSIGMTIRGVPDNRQGAVQPWPRSGGWLGTGDAVLVTPQDVDLLFSLLDSRVEEVDVMNAPHHGSAHNSATELYGRIPRLPSTVLMPADGRGRYRHPHNQTLRDTIVAGHAAVRVGDDPRQRFMWSVSVY